MSNVQLVQDFIKAWETKDLEKIVSYFAADAFYHNIPMQPITGVPAIREGLKPFVGMASKIKWDLFFIADDGKGNVLTERLDCFEIGGKWLKIPVMGTFEIRNGKIQKWRDYFDMKDFEGQMAKIQAG